MWANGKIIKKRNKTMIKQYNITYLNYRVGTIIILERFIDDRAKILQKFITIAQHCKSMGNFNTAFSIIAVLNGFSN